MAPTSKNARKAAVDKDRIVRADASKSFFIDMLTRDIGVVDCILDLIDNAIDQAVEGSKVEVMKLLESGELNDAITGARIDIEYSSGGFRMYDTCGGISVDDARSRVFLHGNPDERGASHGLSVYGIGMKRAFFKLGSQIQIHSETNREFFDISIDVDDWKAKPQDWWFEFQDFGPKSNGAGATEILMTRLRDGIADRFQLPSFASELKSRIASTYALFLRAGVVITVNGDSIIPRMPQIVAEPFRPVRKRLEFEGVDILLIASLSPRNDRTPHGWYVFCNGRMVLEADKTSMTGWGDGIPAFHTKYNHFVGFAYFESNDVRKLPWRTTKQGVEKESPVYQLALAEMKIQARPILDFLNNMYPGDLEPEGIEERDLFRDARSISIDELSRSEATFTVQRSTRRKSAEVSVQYIRPRDLVRRVAKHIGLTKFSAARVGEVTFDYYVANEMDV